jgi:hypothetical protein
VSFLSTGSCLRLALVGIAFSYGTASANDVYIAQSAAGSANGSSCANAVAYGYFNTSGNWTSGAPSGTKIGPGTTVHLCGTFTAPAGSSSYLVTQGSGTSGSPITIHFESGAVIQAPYWAGSVLSVGNNYITVDGGGSGLIQATANGTALSNKQDGAEGVALPNGCTGCIIQGLTVANLYVHTNNVADSGAQDTYCFYVLGSATNVTIQGNVCHDTKAGMLYAYRTGDSNFTFANNQVYNADHGMFIGNAGSGSTLTGLYIYGNSLHDGGNWDDTAQNNHHDGIHTWAFNSSTLSNEYIYNNYCYGNWGADTFDMNSCSFHEVNTGGVQNGAYIFNNVFTTTNCPNNGYITYEGNNLAAYNNTIIGPKTSCSIGIQYYGSGNIFENNIVSTLTMDFLNAGGSIQTQDYNDSYNVSSRNSAGAHSITSNPNLNSSYQPQAGSPVIGAGLSLTSLNIAALDGDKSGVSRSASGAWDIGAYTSSGAAPSPPSVPPSVSTTIQ